MKNKLLTLLALHVALTAALAQPVITNQPLNQTAIAGATATFSVGASGTAPLSYQWRSHANASSYTNIPFGTEATLVLTNVQPTSRRFAVVVTEAGGLSATSSPLVTLTASPLPTIIAQPTNQSVSLGANIRFLVSAASTHPPLQYQWRLAGTNLENQTNTTLNLTNAHLVDAGDYDAVVTDSVGSVTSRVAHLEIDPTFTKITSGGIVNVGGFSFGCAWGDYDNDGFPDLFVANYGDGGTSGNDFLYHNDGNGSFTRISSGTIVNDGVWSISGAWSDYDNDGDLDLFVCMPGRANTLYRNDGNGTFTRTTTSPIATDIEYSHTGIWGDFDNDGWLDLFIANFANRTTSIARDDVLYRSDGNGGFIRTSFGPKTPANGQSWNAAWGDFDNDGYLDLFVPHGGTALAGQHSFLYRNNRAGGFSLLSNSVVFADSANATGCAWGDFNNDGYLDLFVAHFYGQNNALYQNNGDGSFSAITNSVVTLDGGTSVGGAWADYDNDGWLDLFVSNLGPVDAANLVSIREENNFLYHNNGDGSFTRITNGSPVNDFGYSTGCAWGDFDNDGFLDLFVSNGWITQSQNNFLYRNNGNSNAWLALKLVGTLSNRSAIGAKVRVRAVIARQTRWQLREITGGGNYGSQNDLRASFGLGDAIQADVIRIEWPSGAVQELTNVAAKQVLTITELPGLRSVGNCADGLFPLQLTGWAGSSYAIDTSSNMTEWTPWRIISATNRTTRINAPCPQELSRFYRALPAN